MVLIKQTTYKPTRWTPQAIHCYMRGGVCSGCSYKVQLESIDRCFTKKAVIELVRLYGKPNENLLLAEKGLRKCLDCGKVMPIEDYWASDTNPSPYCPECARARGALYRQRHKEKLRKGA